jgi:hypothetical protein
LPGNSVTVASFLVLIDSSSFKDSFIGFSSPTSVDSIDCSSGFLVVSSVSFSISSDSPCGISSMLLSIGVSSTVSVSCGGSFISSVDSIGFEDNFSLRRLL